MFIKELREKKDSELIQLFENLKAELFMLRFKNKTGQLDKPHKIPVIKKNIAKIITIQNARKLDLEKQNSLIKSAKIISKNDKMYHKELIVKKKSVKDKGIVKDNIKNEK